MNKITSEQQYIIMDSYKELLYNEVGQDLLNKVDKAITKAIIQFNEK